MFDLLRKLWFGRFVWVGLICLVMFDNDWALVWEKLCVIRYCFHNSIFWTLQICLDWKDKRWENVRLCDPIFADHLTQQRKVEHTFLSSSLSWELKKKNFLEQNILPKSASCELWQFQNLQCNDCSAKCRQFHEMDYWFWSHMISRTRKQFHSSHIRCVRLQRTLLTVHCASFNNLVR